MDLILPPRPRPEQLARWSSEIEALTRRIGQLELEATFVFCHLTGAALLRAEARRLMILLEQLKAQ